MFTRVQLLFLFAVVSWLTSYLASEPSHIFWTLYGAAGFALGEYLFCDKDPS